MRAHSDRHPRPVDGCFGCKVLSVSAKPSSHARRRSLSATLAHDREVIRDCEAANRMQATGATVGSPTGAARHEWGGVTQTSRF